MTPEGKVKAEIKRLLTEHAVRYVNYVPVGFGKHGEPDFYCWAKGGIAFVIEVKADAKSKITGLQAHVLKEFEALGFRAFLSHADNLDELREYLQELTDGVCNP